MLYHYRGWRSTRVCVATAHAVRPFYALFGPTQTNRKIAPVDFVFYSKEDPTNQTDSFPYGYVSFY